LKKYTLGHFFGIAKNISKYFSTPKAVTYAFVNVWFYFGLNWLNREGLEYKQSFVELSLFPKGTKFNQCVDCWKVRLGEINTNIAIHCNESVKRFKKSVQCAFRIRQIQHNIV